MHPAQGLTKVFASDDLGGVLARRLFPFQPVDLVVTDIMMPRMTGPEFAQRVFRLNPDLRILFISGYTDKAIIHHRILSPGTAYLQKPFTPDVLGRKVREVLDGPQTKVA